jgi:hypothetical protein
MLPEGVYVGYDGLKLEINWKIRIQYEI